MKVQQPSLWTLGLGALDLGREKVSDVKRSLRDYHSVPFKVVAGGVLLTLGLGLVAMDLVRWQPLRAWWGGELARRGEQVGSQIQHPQVAMMFLEVATELDQIGLIEAVEIDGWSAEAVIPPECDAVTFDQLQETLDDSLF